MQAHTAPAPPSHVRIDLEDTRQHENAAAEPLMEARLAKRRRVIEDSADVCEDIHTGAHEGERRACRDAQLHGSRRHAVAGEAPCAVSAKCLGAAEQELLVRRQPSIRAREPRPKRQHRLPDQSHVAAGVKAEAIHRRSRTEPEMLPAGTRKDRVAWEDRIGASVERHIGAHQREPVFDFTEGDATDARVRPCADRLPHQPRNADRRLTTVIVDPVVRIRPARNGHACRQPVDQPVRDRLLEFRCGSLRAAPRQRY